MQRVLCVSCVRRCIVKLLTVSYILKANCICDYGNEFDMSVSLGRKRKSLLCLRAAMLRVKRPATFAMNSISKIFMLTFCVERTADRFAAYKWRGRSDCRLHMEMKYNTAFSWCHFERTVHDIAKM